jgi:Ca-activated chloride channel family protein
MHCRYIAALLLIGFASVAEPQGLLQDARPDFQISVNVDLVVLQATVRDRGGRVVSDLKEQDFEVYEDGVRQTIQLFRHEDIPVTVGLVVDHSGSMRPKLTDVIQAARTFARSSNPEDRMFVVNFNEKVTLGLPAGMSFTNSADELERAIAGTRSVGRTALYDAAVSGLAHLQTGGPDKKVLIVISDGGDNASVLHLPAVLKKFEQSSAVVYAIGIFDEEDPDQNPGLLRRLARANGGEAFFPARLGDVVAVCERIARDIRSQYTIGYVSTSTTRPGALRAIRMVAHAAGKGSLSVRTRTGYIPAGIDVVK